jgi:hypothetical protein
MRLFANPFVVGSARPPFEAVAVPAAKESRTAFQRLMGHQQVTDSYLRMPARRASAVFLTFDKRLTGVAEPDTRVDVLG